MPLNIDQTTVSWILTTIIGLAWLVTTYRQARHSNQQEQRAEDTSDRATHTENLEELRMLISELRASRDDALRQIEVWREQHDKICKQRDDALIYASKMERRLYQLIDMTPLPENLDPDLRAQLEQGIDTPARPRVQTPSIDSETSGDSSSVSRTIAPSPNAERNDDDSGLAHAENH